MKQFDKNTMQNGPTEEGESHFGDLESQDRQFGKELKISVTGSD